MAGIDRWLHYTVTTIDRFHCISVGLSRLLPANLPTLRDELASIPSVHVAVMNVEYCGKDILPPQFAQVCVCVCV